MKKIIQGILLTFLFFAPISLERADAVDDNCQSILHSENGVFIDCPSICAIAQGDFIGLCQFTYDKKVGDFHLEGVTMVFLRYQDSILKLDFNMTERGPLHLKNESTGEVHEVKINTLFFLDLPSFSIIYAVGSVEVDGTIIDIRPIKETVFQFLWF